MEFRKLGRTNLQVSVLGLGGGGRSRLGRAYEASPDDVSRLVRRALELGINLFDTAADYGTEELLAPALGEVARESFVLSTKFGPTARETGLKPAVALRTSLQDSLRRLQTEYVDVLYLHGARADQYDTIAEIPGTDKKDEVVMLGAHLDSWHAGTGATDNGAGTVVMMEAVRILKALDIKPRRTVRIGLWSGEEQGLLGSQFYVQQHFGSRPAMDDPAMKGMPTLLRREAGPVTVKPEQAKISAYFNVDNGTGKIRGIYLQENAAVAPIFEAWMRPFKDLGMTAMTMRNTGGTDHLSFDAAGIPGFQFIQDPIEYETRTHHSNMDVYDRLQPDDLKQMAVIVASFVYDAAMRDQMLPRKPIEKPLPKEPEKKEDQ